MNNNRSMFIVDIATLVVLLLIVIYLLVRVFIVGPSTSPAGPGGGAQINPSSAITWVAPN